MIKLTDILFEGKLSKSEIKKMKDKFDKTGKLPPHLQKLADLMKKNTKVKDIVVPGLEWMAEEKLTEGFDLKKLEDAIKMFQKKIKKQGRVTNARDENHLKQLIKVYKDMGGRKIKEEKLTEVRTSKAGFEVLDKMTYGQGSRFGRMTNANYLNHTPKGIVFGGSKWKHGFKKVEIIKTGKNKFTIEFAKGIKPGQKVVKKNIEGEMIHSTLKQALGI